VRITLERRPGGVTLTVAPAGARGGIGGLVLLGVLGGGFCCLLLCLLLPGALRAREFHPVLLIPLALLAGAVAALLAGADLAARRAVLGAAGGRLTVVETGLFASRRGEWDAGDLLDVRAAPSRVAVNNRPLPQLQVVPRRGEPFALLTGSVGEELDCVAGVLRRELGLAGTPGPD
jgi:hypothetical protein